jgi:putative endonuclease
VFVYIVSNKSHRLYVGCTKDLLRRFEEHKTRKYPSSFTARYTFDRLVWFEVIEGVAAAEDRERKIKHWPRVKKIALIQERNPNWLDLSSRLDWTTSLV